MSATIKRNFDFQAAIYFENKFLLNYYEMTLNMNVNTDSIFEQNIAMERLKYIVYECFENSIFVSQLETNIIEKYKHAGLKVVPVPDDPYDQIISLLILLKTNAICEGKLKITDIIFGSKLSDDVEFLENLETAQHVISSNGWWTSNLPSLNSPIQSKKSKIVKLVKDEWAEFGLSWKEKRDKTNEVVFSLKDKNQTD